MDLRLNNQNIVLSTQITHHKLATLQNRNYCNTTVLNIMVAVRLKLRDVVGLTNHW